MYSLTHLLLLQLSLLAAAADAAAEPWPQAPATPISCEALLPLAHELVLAFCFDGDADAGGLSTPRQLELCDRARRQLGYTGGVEPSKPAWNLYNLILSFLFLPAALSAIAATEYPAGDAYDSLDEDADANKASDSHQEAEFSRGRRVLATTPLYDATTANSQVDEFADDDASPECYDLADLTSTCPVPGCNWQPAFLADKWLRLQSLQSFIPYDAVLHCTGQDPPQTSSCRSILASCSFMLSASNPQQASLLGVLNITTVVIRHGTWTWSDVQSLIPSNNHVLQFMVAGQDFRDQGQLQPLLNLPLLRSLVLSNCYISSLSPGFLADMPDLQMLQLKSIGLVAVNAAMFARSPNLTYIDLSKNFLTSLPPGLFQANTLLTTLSLDGNSLTGLPANLFQANPLLNLLDLSSNFLTSLSANLFQGNTGLATLSLNNNSLTSLPANLLQACPLLANLDLSGNCLTELPDNFLLNNPLLSQLHLDYNQLTSLSPAIFAPNVNLTILTVFGNSLSNITDVLISLPLLTVLDVADNSLSGDFTVPVNITTLTLSNNNVQRVILNVNGSNINLLDVSYNPGLHELSRSRRTISSLTISGTQLPFQAFMCSRSVEILQARSMQNPSWQNSSLTSILQSCAGNVGLLDLTGNELPPLDSFANFVNTRYDLGVWLYGVAPVGDLEPIYLLTAFLLDASSIQCSPFITVYSVLSHPVLQYNCTCVTGYATNDAGYCAPIPPTPFWDTAVFGAIIGVFIGVFVILIVTWRVTVWFKRRAKLAKDELHRKLLEQENTIMEGFRTSWTVDYSAIQLVKRIDMDSPGSFGTVWLAKMDDLTVAVKILREDLLELDAQTVEEFGKEADFLMKARHSNLVRFFGAGKTDRGAPFLVLEYVSRGSLNVLLRGQDKHCLTPTVKVHIAEDIARGMAFIHSFGSLHRDLKPGNVLITEHFHAKVSDFGSIRDLLMRQHGVGGGGGGADPESRGRIFSIFSPPSSLDSRAAEASLTAGVGTLPYMAPEVLRGDVYAKSADVWSYGVTIWQLMEARSPDLLAQEGETGRGVERVMLLAHLERGARLRLSANQPVWARQIVADCFAAVPNARPTFEGILVKLRGFGVRETEEQAGMGDEDGPRLSDVGESKF